MEEFGATDYMVRRAKALAKEKGILATPNPKLSGKTLIQRAVEQVKEWYRSDEVSRVMPWMKDFVSMKIQIQKRLILCNLREAYESFKTKHRCQALLYDIGGYPTEVLQAQPGSDDM